MLVTRARQMRARLARRGRAAASESGFSLVIAILVLAAASLLSFAAIDGVTGDAQLVRNSLDQNRALDAAQAGLAAFRQQLAAGGAAFWQSCPGVNGATGVTGLTGQTAVPNSTDAGSTEYYSYFELPATTAPSGDNKCDPANPASTILEGNSVASNSFRVEVRGTSNNVSRTIVAELTPLSFLNYVWFTNYEDADPQYENETTNLGGYPPAGPAESTVSGLNCAVYYWAGRSQNCTVLAHGAYQFNGPVHSNDDMFVCGGAGNPYTIFGRTSADAIEAPNVLDSTFDEWKPSYFAGGSCNTAQSQEIMTGTPDDNVTTLGLPTDATQLLKTADGASGTNVNGCFAGYGCEFNGPTTIVLDGPTSSSVAENQMTVTNANFHSGVPTKVNYPPNGVVYVNATGSCTYSYTPYTNENQLYGGTTLDTNSGDTANAGCGDAIVQAAPYTGTPNGTPYSSPTSCGNGTTSVSGVCPYTQSLTIGASNDIIIASSLTTTSTSSGCAAGWYTNNQPNALPETSCPTGSATLGLVANHEVRIFHPVTGTRTTVGHELTCPSGGGLNGTGSLVNPVVDAAILAINGSFTVDNLDCGAGGSGVTGGYGLGQLTVNGATATNFFGQPAESNGYTGYSNNYWYDSRLATDLPPYFPQPTNNGWQVVHEVECDTSC